MENHYIQNYLLGKSVLIGRTLTETGLSSNLILSFVVQNFENQTPFLIKTQKQHVYSKWLSSPLVSLFVKEKLMRYTFNIFFSKQNSNPWILFFSFKYFSKNLFKLFKNLLYFRLGLLTNQSILSYNHHLVENLYKTIFLFTEVKSLTPPHEKGLNARILDIVITVSFSFHKDTYNTLIFYIFSLLLTPYVATVNEFELRYSYIILPSHFQMYLFLNLFYFRINNY